MAAASAMGMPNLQLGIIAAQHHDLIEELGTFDPFKLASMFGGLLTTPELQSNCLRLEALVHLALAFGDSKRKPSAKFLSHCFSVLGEGPAGWLEDPAEDVFVRSIARARVNFRVLEGLWESAGFFLHRFMNGVQ